MSKHNSQHSPLGATVASPWVNSLGMKFTPVPGTDALFSIWQTRKQDFAAYADSSFCAEEDRCLRAVTEKQRLSELDPPSGMDAPWRDARTMTGQPVSFALDHPVVGVSGFTAQEFCMWLTGKERREGWLPEGTRYRLPMDWEWSLAVGLDEPRSGTPDEKNQRIQGVYPWGTQWPPPAGAGNYADITAGNALGTGFIEGYDDGYATTSPVGSFTANQFGLYDMGGNVWEHCCDESQGLETYVGRGGAWTSNEKVELLSSKRRFTSDRRYWNQDGFRCVLVGGQAELR